jgi:UDP-GlcNAc:undecaprenyl-phosphate GlcNAc-1-phosphate transferase
VLIFYGWTAVISIGCLLFFATHQLWIPITFLAVGLVVCTAITLAPLGRRKAQEAVAELTPAGSSGAQAAAKLDPLDAAAHPDEDQANEPTRTKETS